MHEHVKQQWQELAEQGVFVFPLAAGDKNPGELGIKWSKTWVEKKRNPWPQLASAYDDEAEGLWMATGRISMRVVLDIDKPEAGDFWRERLGADIYDKALRCNTGKGHHLHFRIPPDDDRPWDSHSDNELGYDFRGDGGGVVIPPSVHASGRVYEWAGGELLDAPDTLRQPAHPKPSNVKSLDKAREKKTPGSTLAGLLADPPHEGGRNNWLTKVGGHLARLWPTPMEDGYLELMRYIGTTLPDPLEEDEVAKTAESVWSREKSHTVGLTFLSEAGMLASRDGRLYTPVKGEDGNTHSREWANFDLVARRVVQERDERVFYVDVITAHTTYTNEPLRADVLGSINRLNVWLAAHHIVIGGQPNDLCKLSYGSRLIQYLLYQNPPTAQLAEFYGHQDDGTFLTPDGLVEGGGVVPFRSTIPAPHLSGWVNYRYGTCPPQEAADVLREVLTFQDEVTASVFGSWWVMALLKGRYQSSLFPFMMLEAGSGSGKTTGFFALMVALAGNRDGAGQQTFAGFRDAVASHRNGVAWLDDLTEVELGKVMDVVRQATSEGNRGKKGADNRVTERVNLMSPIMISGEGSGTMMSEKAMRDRAVKLSFSSPKDRMSLHDSSRPQWDDILALQARYGGHTKGLTAVSGALVAQILAREPLLAALGSLRPSGAGRHADKMALLRMGARILDDLLQTTDHSARVDKWVGEQADTGAANLAVNEIIPWFLRTALLPTSPKGKQAAFYNPRTETVWVHVGTLADQWHGRYNLSARERQLGTEAAIETELKALGCGKSKVKEYGPRTASDSGRARYVEIPASYTPLIMERAGLDVSGGHEED